MMILNDTLTRLRALRLTGMAAAAEEQASTGAATSLAFEERLAMLVDRELLVRNDKQRAALLKRARLKYPKACIEDLDARSARGIDRSALMSLALSRWVENATTLILTGPTGSGKSWLACALAQNACRRGQSALYLRIPRLADELRILHGKGTFVTWLESVARVDVLILDDWGVSALDSGLRSDLLEIIDDRCGTRATIMTSQLPVEHWHAWIGDQTIADAILDRLLSRSHRIQLRGESLRPREPLSADQGGSKTEN